MTQWPLSPSSSLANPGSSLSLSFMWPRSLIKQLFGSTMRSNSLPEDFPDHQIDQPVAVSDGQQNLWTSSDDEQGTHKYSLFASTWNVGGIPPSDDLSLDDWLDTKDKTYEIYVLGFQEIVPLSAKNVLGPDRSRISIRWNSIIRATLNKSASNPKEGEDPLKARSFMKQPYECLISKQMVGILVTVWVRGDLRRYIRNLAVSSVGCGIMGWLGNKGSVSVRFLLHETSLCFVCCHLASGGREGDEMHRNTDATDIFSRTSFRQRGPCLPQRILDHDRIILLGDLNYRISLPLARTRTLVKRKQWQTLLESDQLIGEIAEGRAFDGWHEGEISFSPTYKYYQNTDEYYGCFLGNKEAKLRAPAWCDRVLWYGRGLTQTNYDRCNSRLSDHRPVRAFFIVEAADNPRNNNSLRNFFLSERFNHISTNFEMFPPDYLLDD